MTNNQLTGLGADHPANGPLTTERLGHVRYVLQRNLQYSNGGSMDYIIADAVKAIDELLKVRKVEPVAFIGERMLEDVTDGARSCGRIWSDGTDEISGERRIPLYAAPPAPVVMKDHQIRELVNELRDIAVEYHGTQQLRERIARTISAAMLNKDKNNG